MSSEREFNSLQTPETQPKIVVGVWLMIVTPENKLFVVKNLKAKFKSQKVPGQLNAPAETYRSEDETFMGTIERAIQEEIGELQYDITKITLIGLNRLNIPDSNVVAAPYLIPIEKEDCLIYKPNDPTESTNPQWINISDTNFNATLKLGQFQVPYFRTPMLENIQMIVGFQQTALKQIRRSTIEPISQEVYKYLEENFGSNIFSK